MRETRAYTVVGDSCKNVVGDRCAKLDQKLQGAQSAAAREMCLTNFWMLVDAWRGNAIFAVIYYMVGRGVMEKSIPFGVYHALFGISINFLFSVKDVLQTYMKFGQARKTILDINGLSKRGPVREGEGLRGAREAATNNALLVDGLSLEKQGKAVVDRASFHLPSGAVTALVGPSGAGKSSLLKAVAGTESRSSASGNVTLGADDLWDFEDLNDAVILVPQQPVLFPDTVKYNIDMGRTDESDDFLQECIKIVGASDFLPSRLEKEVHVGTVGQEDSRWTPSGGEAQRISIARALFRRPRILLLDEPTSALDAQTEMLVFKNLKELAIREQIAILMVTHRLSLAKESDRVIVMANGTIVQNGTHTSLVRDKQGVYSNMIEDAKF